MNKQAPISLMAAISPLLLMLCCLTIGSQLWSMSGDLIIASLLSAAALAGFLAIKQGCQWQDIEKTAGLKIASAMPAILIVLCIGILIGTWVFSGTIPLLVYYGLHIINPEYLVITAFMITAMMSLFTGTSWGSAGTIGVALMGIATIQQFPLPVVAGAVISGAYFGDKLSPLSDSTNICAIGAKASLYKHIQNMLYTTVPSFILCLIVFFIAGQYFLSEMPKQQLSHNQLTQDISKVFQLHPVSLLPLMAALAGILLRYPAALVMLLSSVVAMIIGVTIQGFELKVAIHSAISGFDIQQVIKPPTDITAYSESLIKLVNRGGLSAMANTLLIVICAFLLATGLELSGALNKILQSLLKRIRSVFGLISSTLLSGITMISLTSHGAVSALLIGDLFQQRFQDYKLANENLSRSMEDSITIIDPLLPWTVSGMFMASTLGVATLDYLPWTVFCFSGMFFSLLYSALYSLWGFGIKRL